MPRKVRMNMEQLAARLDQVRDAMAAMMSTGDIVEHFSAEWRVDPRTIHGYIAKVRDQLRRVKLITMTTDQRAEEQNRVIDGIKRSVAVAWARTDAKGKSIPDLLAVQRGNEQLCKIYGVFADRLEISGPGGGSIPIGGPGLTSKLQKIVAEAEKRKATPA